MGGVSAESAGGRAVVMELPEGLADALEKEARRSRRTVPKLLEQLLEDLADARAAEAAYKKHIKTGGKTYSMREVFGA